MSDDNEAPISAKRLAEILTEAANGLTATEYTRVLEDVLGETTTSDVARVASFMPPELQGLLPRKYTH
jgi:hypothetical protein